MSNELQKHLGSPWGTAGSGAIVGAMRSSSDHMSRGLGLGVSYHFLIVKMVQVIPRCGRMVAVMAATCPSERAAFAPIK